MKKKYIVLLAALLLSLFTSVSPASASGGTITVDPEGSGSSWSHGTYDHMVTTYIDYPATDSTPIQVKINWNKSVGGQYMCLVTVVGGCPDVGKYSSTYSEDNANISSTPGAMGNNWVFVGDGPWGAGRRLLLAYYPHNGYNTVPPTGVYDPGHGEVVALRVNFRTADGNWLTFNSQVVTVTS